ncbi:MAG TPA: glycosyltransferase family 1 protein [Gemmatimonadales bacterium]|nr:glycosyltransferase family 1 protein [Gemmatimonadales bacterium]
MPDGDAGGRLELVVNARHLTGPRTGIEVYMETLLRELARRGRVHITVLSWAPLDLGLTGVREVVSARRPDFPQASLQATLWKLWFDQWGCLRSVPRKNGILFHGMDGFLPFALRARDRCVATVHDLGWQVHPELYSQRVRLMYRALFPWVVRRADRFIAVSRYTADDLVRRAGVPAARIDVVHHGLDPLFTAPPGGMETGEAPPYVLAVGGVSPRKNTRRLIDAFTRWRERGGRRRAYRLLITGTSLDSDFFRNGATPPEHVALLGYVDKTELPRLYAGAAAFLYPGIYEGFGLPILEAMACGAPVVTSTTGAAPEIAGDAAILVDPFDVTSIADGLERATMPPEAARLRALGRERVKQFDWDAAAAATEAVYRRLL